jgi:hypothetical protein
MTPLALLLAAYAAEDQLAIELGSTGTPDPAFEVFSNSGAMFTWGLRYGLGMGDNTALVFDWQHAVQGGITAVYDAEGYDFESYDYDLELWSSFTSDQLAVGPKLDVELADGFLPYVTVQAVGMRGRVRFDEDIESVDNENEIKRAALTGGVAALAGLELVLAHDDDDWVKPSAHLEMGYSHFAPLRFEDWGSLAFRGFALRAGVGVHF